MKRLVPYIALIVIAIALDQWVKQWVETHLPLREPVEILPFLALYRTYNTGIAFSSLDQIGDNVLALIAIVVCGLIVYLASRTRPSQVLARTGFALIIAGALGNLIDRLTLGHVVDYVLFHTPVWSFAIFNLADAFITIGAILVIVDEFLGWGRVGEPKEPGSG